MRPSSFQLAGGSETIVLAGTLLFSRFIRDVAIMKCVTAGHQDCAERIVAAA